MAMYFLPGDSPLVKHIIQSYNKHHAPSNLAIPEDVEVNNEVKVVKPSLGIHVKKLDPIIQDYDYIYSEEPKDLSPEKEANRGNTVIRISNLLMSKNDYLQYMREDLKKNSEMDEMPYSTTHDMKEQEIKETKSVKTKDKSTGTVPE